MQKRINNSAKQKRKRHGKLHSTLNAPAKISSGKFIPFSGEHKKSCSGIASKKRDKRITYIHKKKNVCIAD